MIQYRRYHAWSTAAVLLALFAEASSTGAWSRLILVLPFIVSAWWIFRSRVVSPIPRWLINTLLFLATAYVFYSVLRILRIDPERTVTILAEYLVSLITIKSFESRTPRDQAQLLILSGMLAIAAVLSSITLPVALLLFAYAPTLLMAIMHFQVYNAVHQSLGPVGRPHKSILDTHPPDGQRRSFGFAALTLLSTIVIAVLGVCVFLVMPRGYGESNAGTVARAGAGASVGFRDSLNLIGSGIISDSPSIVAEVEIFSREGRVTLATQQYFRGAVLDQYNKDVRAWQRSFLLRERVDEEVSTRLWNDKDRMDVVRESPFRRTPRAVLDQRFRIFDKESSHLFALWRPTEFASKTSASLYLNPFDATLLLPHRDGFVEYWVRSDPSSEEIIQNKDVARFLESYSEVQRRYRRSIIESPIRDLAIDALAEQGIRFDPDNPPAAIIIASRLEQYLKDNFTYTLEQEPPPQRTDPIVWFLTQRRAGHCEHFASALAAMCQSLDIPARIVTGFLTSEFDDARGAYIVRQRHAHAWVEVEVEEAFAVESSSGESSLETATRWNRFDPTPSASLAALNRPETGIGSWFRYNFERLEQAWVLRVVAFDASSQEQFLESAGIDSVGPIQWMERLSQRMLFAFHDPRQRGDAIPRILDRAIVLVLFLVGVASLVTVFLKIRRPRTRPKPRTRARSSIPAYTRMHRLLQRAGRTRDLGTPPLAYARSLASTDTDLADAAIRITNLHYASRFDHRAPTDEQLRQSDEDLDIIRTHLRTGRSRS